MVRYTLIILLLGACRPSGEKIDKTTDVQDSGVGESETHHAATSENVNDAVVVRDAAGNFSATTISANLEGNASSASVAETALNLSGTLTIAKGGTGATNVADARTNLGLGSIATQNANSVSISGGAISGVSFSSTGITDAASSTLLTLTSGGNVGISTASPGEKLTVAGTIESTSGGFKFPAGDVQLRAATAVPHILLFHEEATGVAGAGSTTGGQWNLRPVNVEKRDVYNLVSLSSNQITIAAGSYYC